MAVSFTIDIWCDYDKCADWIFGCVQHYDLFNARKIARENVEKQGWTYKNGKDYCPECTKKMGG